MSLADVAYQASAQRRLQRAMSHHRAAHAYVFHGPDGVGKEMFATGLAELMLCQTPTEVELDEQRSSVVGIPSVRIGCGRCESCRSIAAGVHPDLHFVYRQLNRDHPNPDVRKRKALDIGVDVIRHFLIDRTRLTPMRGRGKVFIVREADRMKPPAQNALLKSLEEPPAGTLIVLLVASPDRLLPTTRSRCQSVGFGSLPTTFVEKRIRAAHPDLPADQSAWYARIGDGSVGRALQHIQIDLFAVNKRVAAALRDLVHAAEPAEGRGVMRREDPGLAAAWLEEAKSLGKRLRKLDPEISDTEATRRGLASIFLLASVWFADLLKSQCGGAGSGVSADASTPPTDVRLPRPRHLIETISRLALAERQLDLNAHPQLCVEVLIDDLGRLAREAPAPTT